MAVIIPFPGPRGRAPLAEDACGLDRFAERYLRTRNVQPNAVNRAIVLRAIAHFPGGLPARRMDVERFIDFAAGPRLRRQPRVLVAVQPVPLRPRLAAASERVKIWSGRDDSRPPGSLGEVSS